LVRGWGGSYGRYQEARVRFLVGSNLWDCFQKNLLAGQAGNWFTFLNENYGAVFTPPAKATTYMSKEYSNGKPYLLDVINVIGAGFMPEQRARRI
jgi:hypothetical protein